MRSLQLTGLCILALSFGALACGGDAGDPEQGEPDPSQFTDRGNTQRLPPPEQLPPPPNPSPGEAIAGQVSAECVAVPQVSARQPVLSFDDGCAETSLQPLADSSTIAESGDARELLVGRWRLCGGTAYYGGSEHEGIEFGSNGRNRLLRSSGGRLIPSGNDARGVYYLLGSGQFMQRGELFVAGYATFASFDPTFSVLQLAQEVEGDLSPLRYVRVAPDEAGAADNTFSTEAAGCSMVGVWDTVLPSANPGAAFAFNERGEWFGGEYGSDLCAAHTMSGTYNLETRGGPVFDNFDMPPESEFELVTNFGAGSCQFWLSAGFLPTFSSDCNRVRLQPLWDNCTGGRGYLNPPGDDLIRRMP